ncbi:MAG: hypothetical protein OEM24_06170 [Paracoccaceae bacterium]|nr:hypothetical protein [Paracoccaceae bacterium]
MEAVYSPADAIVFLHLRWRNRPYPVRSILVHEFVHHAQQVGGRRFARPAEAEKQACALQEARLASYGLDLEAMCGLDRLTRLAITECTM